MAPSHVPAQGRLFSYPISHPLFASKHKWPLSDCYPHCLIFTLMLATIDQVAEKPFDYIVIGKNDLEAKQLF